MSESNGAETKSPPTLRPYEFHGLDLNIKGEQATGECPFCGKSGKFSVKIDTGQWKCWSCQTGNDKGGGNLKTFLTLLHKLSMDSTKLEDYEQLREHRKLIGPNTLRSWGCCKSIITANWLLPGYGADADKIINLYKYVKMKDGKYVLMATTGCSHGLMFPIDFSPKRAKAYIAEGPWDGMSLWEVLSDPGANVAAVGGCGAVGEGFRKFVPLFTKKNVVLMFDSDHPKEMNGRSVSGAGYTASRNISQLFARAEESPLTLKWVQWGPDGYDLNKPTGYDIRDYLSQSSDRHKAVKELLKLVVPIPDDWIDGRSLQASKDGKTEIETLPCTSWKELVNAWRKALTWTEGLDRALSIMLASILSVRSIGDQLWVKIIGPPACGKSTLCEAVSVNKKRVVAKSTLRGFHSGWKEGDGSENMSLILKLANKTLVTKDGDTLLKSPNYEQILSEARDVYDGTSRSSFKNGMSANHEAIRMTWILCGTGALRAIDSSELGARFIDCVIMEDIDDDLEDEINLSILHRSKRNVGLVGDSYKQQDSVDPDLLKAMQMTGGYIDYLCNNAEELMPRPDDMSPMQDTQIMRCAKFTAYMRARPSVSQDETVEREFSGRLVSQLTRLAMCLTVVLNEKRVSHEVMRRVKISALDTSRGRVLNVCKHLFHFGDAGIEVDYLMRQNHEGRDKMLGLLRYMSRINMVEEFETEERTGTKRRWRLTDKFSNIYKSVITNTTTESINA